MSDTIDCVIVGGGVIGLAIGRELAIAGLEVAVLESEQQVGVHTSSRNSEVIHAGIYYPGESLKASLCVSGKQLLYRYCEARRVPHARLGKLIVANGPTEIDTLCGIMERGLENGVDDLAWCEPSQIRALEPRVRAEAAIHSPSTGIVDSHVLMLSLQGDLEDHDGAVVLGQAVTRIVPEDTGFALQCDGDSNTTARSRFLVNAAGLWASTVARTIDGLDSDQIPQTSYAKGHYFDYTGPSPFPSGSFTRCLSKED